MTKLRFFLALLTLLLVFCGATLWLRTQSPRDTATATPLASGSRPSPGRPAVAAPSKTVAKTAAPASLQSAPVNAAADLAIGTLLGDTSLDNKAVMAGLTKITLDSNRGLEERTEAMSHLLNLSVEAPSAVLLPLIGDARLPDALCNQILDEALNAPLSWQADAYLSALNHRPDKETQAKAHDHLVFLLGNDYGDNLAEWAKAVAGAKQKWEQPAK